MTDMKRIGLIIIAVFLVHTGFSQTITIEQARLQATGSVTVSGIVTNGPELGPIRYLQDETGGIAAYGPLVGDLVPGDEITITGTLKDYNKLLEIDPVSSITINSKGNTLPKPLNLTISQLSDQYEGMLVTIKDAVFNLSGSTFTGKTNYKYQVKSETGEIRISDQSSPFAGKPIPSGKVIITGPLSQYLTTYQILPRTLEDIIPESPINFETSITISNISTTGFNLNWETDEAGTTEAFYGNTPALEKGVISKEGEVATDHLLSIEGATASEVFYIQAFSVLGDDTTKAPVNVYITQSESSGWTQVYFNRPADHSVSNGVNAVYLNKAIDDTLISYINRAKYSIDFTIYNFNNQGISNISDALNAAHNRGVKVRLIYDSNTDALGVNSLDEGIGKIASPESAYPVYGIMHNKFVVFDALSDDPNEPFVWTGSTNFTDGQINTDPNNVILIQDKSLAIAYRLEFNEMYGSDGDQPNAARSRFGPDKTDNTPHEFIIGGNRVECWFSPSDGVNAKILEKIKSSDHDLSIATMLITRTDLGYAITDSKTLRGVETRVLVNTAANCYEPVVNAFKNSLVQNFRESGETGIMHHKYMIVDQNAPDSDPLVLTGSHNWSSSAEQRNDENTLVIHSATMANIYYQDFMARFNPGMLVVNSPKLKNDFVTLSTGNSINVEVTSNDDIPGDFELIISRQATHGVGIIEVDNSITYTPEQRFNNELDTIFYKVCLTSNENLCDSAFMVVFVNKPVTTTKNKLDVSVRVYPNPSSGFINVWIEGNMINNATVIITDIVGRAIAKRENLSSGYPIRFDSAEFKDGVYIVQIETSSGIIQKKIVVKH